MHPIYNYMVGQLTCNPFILIAALLLLLLSGKELSTYTFVEEDM